MKITIAFFLLSIGLTAISFLSANLSAQETDNATGLIVADGWQAVQENCTECHSPLLITQNSGSKTVWESRIRWMQETQGLQQLDEPVEETILAYLSSNYGQKESGRRASLPSSLMPENPYESID
jgi:hypothetical protein